MSNTLIQHLQNPELYSHPIKYFKVIETHASWVILTGDYVYKIKKPVDFIFLDYSSLEKRRYFCNLELELNQILAPELYLEVLPITGSEIKPELNGNSEIIEYVLKMREFPQKNLLNVVAAAGKMTLQHIYQLAKIIADFHAKIQQDVTSYIGTPEQVHEPVIQNFDQIRPLLKNLNDLAVIDELQNWVQAFWQKWYAVFEQRKKTGFIRACHGDIHLGNITLIQEQPVIFDCVEFNEAIRWTDVMADIGFLLMDLQDQSQIEFSHCLLNRYLEITGDYQGLTVLPYYLSYRAMVRAKVNLFQVAHADAAKQQQFLVAYQRFIRLAQCYAIKTKPILLLTHGRSGSGKSTIATKIVKKLGAIQIRSDVERKRMAGLELTASSQSRLYQDLYHPDVTEKVYARLAELAAMIINAGYSVVVDATFAKQAQRELFFNLAEKLKIPCAIVHCNTSEEQMQQSMEYRKQKKDEISEARSEVLAAQAGEWQALTVSEVAQTISVGFDKEELFFQELNNKLFPTSDEN